MEHLNLTVILLALSGMLIHLLMFVLAKTKGNNKFSLKVWASDSMNWIRVALTVISTFALLLMIDEIAAMFGVTVKGHGALLKVVAFSSGYLNHSLIKNILRLFRKVSTTNELSDDK